MPLAAECTVWQGEIMRKLCDALPVVVACIAMAFIAAIVLDTF